MIKYYKGWDGKTRKWRYKDNERPRGRCYDCRRPYGDKHWVDLSISNELWEKINPTYHEDAGLLCPSCIMDRLSVVGSIGSIKLKAYI